MGGIWLGTSALMPVSTPSPPLVTYIVGLGTSRTPSVYVANIDGSAPTALGEGTSALLSPDGTQVAAIRRPKGQANGTFTLLLYPVAGAERKLKESQQFMQLLAWSSDSRLLLVAVGATSASRLMVFDVGSATSTPTVVATGTFDGASFQPGHGNQIVFSRASGSSADLFITASNGGHTRQLTHNGRSEYPVWGTRGIAYSRLTPGTGKGQGPSLQLWLAPPGGGTQRQLTNVKIPASMTASGASAGLTPIAFSADGRHLLANFIGPDQAEAYTLDLSALGHSRRPPPLRDLTGAQNGTIPDAISAKGDLILVTRGKLDNPAALSVQTIRWGGGTPTVVAAHGAYASWDR